MGTSRLRHVKSKAHNPESNARQVSAVVLTAGTYSVNPDLFNPQYSVFLPEASGLPYEGHTCTAHLKYIK